MKKLNSKDWFLLSRIVRRLRGLKDRTFSTQEKYLLQSKIDTLLKVFSNSKQTYNLDPLSIKTYDLKPIEGETKMTNLKKPLMTAIVKAILRLSQIEKSSHNPYTKREIQDEISNLVMVMTGLEDFVSFLLDKLQTEELIRSDERLKIALEKKPKRKTGPLGNEIPEEKSNESNE